MSESQEIIKELADIVVNASNENRQLSSQEIQYFQRMFDKALEIVSLEKEN